MKIASSIYALWLGAIVSVVAVKDDEYYRAGMGNPNVNLKMYWADAHNVLEDLDQLSSLYVQYHNCAWSQNREQYNGEEESGSGDETDYWYMGATPNYAANVAYSLYGSLTGELFSGCNENTFINSFITNDGFEPFAEAIYNAGAASQDYSQSYSSECAGGAGVACDYQVGFAYVTFSTDACDPYYASGITDSMGYMNSAFQSAQCIKIYDGDYQNYQSNDNNNNNNYYYNNGNGRDLQHQEAVDKIITEEKSAAVGEEKRKVEEVSEEKNSENYNNEDRNLQNNYNYGYGYNSYNNYYNYYGTPLALLYYSNACFIQNFWAPNGGCPDPFGRLQVYQANFNKGVRKSMKVDTYVTYRANMKIGKKYVKIGGIFFMAAAFLFVFEQLLTYRSRKKAKRSIKTASTAAPQKSKKKKKRSVVGLVQTASGKMSSAAKSTVAKVTKKAKSASSCGEEVDTKDGVMKSPDDDSVVAGSSYEAPKESSSDDSLVKVETPTR